jgi:hypothetical protein
LNLLIITSKSHIEDTLIVTAETAAKYRYKYVEG